MKTVTMMLAAACACAAMAQEQVAEREESESSFADWRLTVGGFGRGGIETKMPGMGSKSTSLYGAELDLQYAPWQNEDFAVWVGIGGTFCPRQRAFERNGLGRSYSEHSVSDDGFVTYDFIYDSQGRGKVDLGYGELRLMTVPEWKITDALSLGVRLGVAFDWVNAKYSRNSSWAWNSRFDMNIPGVPPTADLDSDSGMSNDSDTDTTFVTQAILGLQATYMFTDWIGLYAAFDWRLGNDAEFSTDAGDITVDMDGYHWSAGVVVSF